MKRFWGHVLAGGSLAVVAIVLSPACVHNDSTLFIRDALAPPLSANGGACLYTADPTQASLSNGLLDVGLSNSYTVPLLVGNQMEPQSNTNSQRTETSRITVQGAVVRITDAVGNQLTAYTTLTSSTVDPGNGTQPGYSPVFVTALDPATGTTLQGAIAAGATRRVISYIKLFGQTLGGQHVESDEFEYPITVCNGCLVQFPTDAINFVLPLPNCLGSTGTGGTAASAPCFFGQDQPVDCRLCVFSIPQTCGGNPGGGPPPVVDAGGGG